MLYLVGETMDFDARRAHNATKRKENELVHIGRGIYCDKEDCHDLPGFMKRNAIRLINYINPEAALAFGSAYRKGAIDVGMGEDGKPLSRLFVAGTYKKVYRLPHLQIVQAALMDNLTYHDYCRPFEDGREAEMGQLQLRCMTDEMVFLKNFSRRRYYPERFLGDKAMVALRKVLEERHGDSLIPNLVKIATECRDLGSELDQALVMLATPLEDLEERPANVATFHIGWAGRKIAQVAFDGMEWRFGYDKGWVLPIIHATGPRPGLIPAYIPNILPEGFAAESISARHVGAGAGRWLIEAGERYLANISITTDPSAMSALPVDCLEGKLSSFRRDGEFTGRLEGIPKVEGGSLANLRDLIARPTIPRIPGYRPKLAMHLDNRGALTPADGRAFTHILKFPGWTNDPDLLMGAVEWACMDLAKAGGLNTAETAMVELPGGAIGLLSERFDIRKDEDDYRMLTCEDLCSAFGLYPMSKYDRSCEEIGEKLRELSTDFAEDAKTFFRQVCVNLFVENGDFHLKNISVLKVAAGNLAGMRSIRLSPVYDVIATRPFNIQLGEDDSPERMALTINGKVYGIELNDLITFGSSLGLSSDQACEIVNDSAEGVVRRAKEILETPPKVILDNKEAFAVVEQCCLRSIESVRRIAPDLAGALEKRTLSRRPF